MKENELIIELMHFGLTRQEAAIYLCLSANRELSGYEVSKLTGISRSNVYSALARLVEVGAAYLLEGKPSRYTAVPVEEFCQNKIHFLDKVREELVRKMPSIQKEREGYITISGHKHILDRIHAMIAGAEYRIYLSLPMEYLEEFRKDLEELLKAEKKVVLLLKEQVDLPGAVVYVTEGEERQLRLIADSAYVLTGDMTGSSDDTCLYCGQKNFVNVFKESMKNEIRLIELTGGK